MDCPAALDAIATYVNSNNSHTCSGKRFKQTADITYSYETAWNSDASYTSNYTPIGGYFNSRDRFFKGTYDGQGHTISGIRINKYGGNTSDENQGLFGMTGDGAVIRGGTLNHNLAIGAIVPSTSDNSHSAICGDNRNTGTLENNYYYGRTLYKDDKWNTLCLPFDVTVGSGQMEGATAMTLNASTSGFNASMGVLTLNFTSVATGNTIAAGTPFIVKWTGSNVTDPVFTGVTIDNSIEAVARKTVTSSDNKVQFIGSYNTVPLTGSDKSNLYLGDGNNLYWPSDDVTLGAFRAYFHVDLSGSAGIKEFVLNFGEDDADGIDIPTPDPSRDGGEVIFNLAGQRLQKMQKGININNGKKIIIK